MSSGISRRAICIGALASGRGAAFDNASLARQIVNDTRLPRVRKMGLDLLATGLRAGSTYPEVWIRDTNTFIEASLPVNDHGAIRTALLNFFLLQGPDGDIVDGYVPKGKSAEPPYRTSPQLPELMAFKNTVESDQESSLVSAVRKYVEVTGDRKFLQSKVDGATVLERLDAALSYLPAKRWDTSRGLIWGGASVDWGDVQPEEYPGTHISENSHKACGIYNNAMFAIAIADYLALVDSASPRYEYWAAAQDRLRRAIRTHLWDKDKQKFIPHIYLNGSPFPAGLDESAIYYFGGTAIAIEAGLLDRREIVTSLEKMRANVQAAGAGSIGLTIYPPYPSGFYKDPILREPYTYQNGGDWDWFGARMVQQLIRLGMVKDAYREVGPMVDRILLAHDFYEWWSRDNQPRGSAKFRGAAGVMVKAIDMLTAWAKLGAGN